MVVDGVWGGGGLQGPLPSKPKTNNKGELNKEVVASTEAAGQQRGRCVLLVSPAITAAQASGH